MSQIIGKVGMTPRGMYERTRAYERLDVVTYQGSSWVAIVDVPAQISPAMGSDYWQLQARMGETGPQGPVGPQGNSAFDGTGVELVNNLTQGGQTAALSAEQGKILKQELTELESEVRIMQGEQYYKPSIISGEYVAYEPMGQIVKGSDMARTEVLLLDGLDAIGLGSEDKWFSANYCCFYDEAMNPLKMHVFSNGSFAPLNNTDYFPIRPTYLIVSASSDKMEGMSIALQYDKSLSLPCLRADVNLLIEQTTTHSLEIDTLQTAVSEHDKQISCLETSSNIMQGKQYYEPRLIKGEYVAYTPKGQIVKGSDMARTNVICLDGIDSIGLGDENDWYEANYCCFYDDAMNPLTMWNFTRGNFAPLNNNESFPTRPKYLIVSASSEKIAGLSIVLIYDNNKTIPTLRNNIEQLGTKTNIIMAEIDSQQQTISELEYSIRNVVGDKNIPFIIIENEYILYANGEVESYEGWNRTDFIALEGLKEIEVNIDSPYCWFYDAERKPLLVWNFGSAHLANLYDERYFVNKPSFLRISADAEKMNLLKVLGKYEEPTINSISNKLVDAELSKPKDLKLLYLNRWVANNNVHNYLTFYYGGDLLINGRLFTNEELIEAFTSEAKGNYDVKSNEFSLFSGYMLVIDSDNKLSIISETKDYNGIILLANPLLTEDNPSEIYGALYDLYKRELSNDLDYCLTGNTIHSWLQKSVEDKMNLLASEVDEESMVALVSTDVHGQPYNRVSTPIYGVLNYVCKNFAPRYYIDLGDSIVQWLSVYGNKNQGLSNLRNVASIANIQEKFFVVGNHDYNSNNQTSAPNNLTHLFTDKEVFNSIGRCMNGRVVWGSKEKMYYYRDFEDVKLRIIVLNTQDRIMRFNDAGEMISRDPMTYCGIRQEQMDWFANVALDFSDKTDKSEWTTLVYSHIPLSPSYNQSPQVQNDVCVWDIMEAFKKGSSMTYSYTDTSEDADLSVNITKDFSSQGAMNLIGNICGHEHRQSYLKDGVLTYGWDYKGIACRVINCGYPYQNTEYLGITYHQKAWTPNGYSLGVTIFNPSKRLFRITYFGYGEDEIINY